MTSLPDDAARSLEVAIEQEGFAFVGHGPMRGLLEHFGSLDDWDRFAGTWSDLAVDSYLAATGRQRRRRHCVFSAAAAGGPILPEPHQPHYQSLHYNSLQGDIERWFEPVLPEAATSDSLATVIGFSRAVFERVARASPRWHIEVHQFRIEPHPDQPGEPTPEGMHRDGVDYVLVLLVDRANIARGTTSIHANDGSELGSFTLAHPLDAALVEDARVFHGVTAVTPLDPSMPAHRDVLVVTFRAVPDVPPTSPL